MMRPAEVALAAKMANKAVANGSNAINTDQARFYALSTPLHLAQVVELSEEDSKWLFENFSFLGQITLSIYIAEMEARVTGDAVRCNSDSADYSYLVTFASCTDGAIELTEVAIDIISKEHSTGEVKYATIPATVFDKNNPFPVE